MDEYQRGAPWYQGHVLSHYRQWHPQGLLIWQSSSLLVIVPDGQSGTRRYREDVRAC
jgi:hypothetical protein